MQTMATVIRHGMSDWPSSLLPDDEYRRRWAELMAAAAQQDWKCAVIVGSSRYPGPMVYYTNYPPTSRPAALLLAAGQEPIMFAGNGGARDHPYIRRVSPVKNLRYDPRIGHGVATELAAADIRRGAVGISGLSRCVSYHEHGQWTEDLERYDLKAADECVSSLTNSKRPREIRMLGIALHLADRTASAALAAYEGGSTCGEAMGAGDRAGRSMGCSDVRGIYADGNGALRPYRNPRSAEFRCEQFSGYFVLEWCGYTAERAFSWRADRAATRADGVLSAVVDEMTTGSPDAAWPALLRGNAEFGQGTGVRARTIGTYGEGADALGSRQAALRGGEVLGLLAWAADSAWVSLASQTLHYDGQGWHPLAPIATGFLG